MTGPIFKTLLGAGFSAVDRPISDPRLKSFYSIKLQFKSKSIDLKSTVTIDYRM
jgi:hypothetical protein